MPLYREKTETQTITKTTFVRSNLITIDYPNRLAPSITFVEELIERVDGNDTSKGYVGQCSETFLPENAQEEFDLLDPATGAVVGRAKYQDVQALLYSLYFHVASKRDARDAADE